MRALSRLQAAIVVLAVLAPLSARPDTVVPAERVKSGVVVREGATRGSARLGSLRPGQAASYEGTEAGWHRVRLEDGTPGYVSAAWTRVLPGGPPQDFLLEARHLPAERTPVWRRLLDWSRFLDLLVSVVRPSPRVSLVIEEPVLGRELHRGSDPHLPVAGFVTLASDRLYDIVLALDVSASTHEFAHADVDGDGILEDAWKGDDSILRAQTTAAEGFVRALRRLPGNHDGRRIRVGVVAFAGDDERHLDPRDRDFEATPGTLFALGRRDAELHVALTHDYARALRSLRGLARRQPAGMTSMAAGIARAVAELDALQDEGAASRPRPDVQRVVYVLTDGKPRLPYDRPTAQRAALGAARLAAERGIRINTFVLGRDAVRGKVHESIVKMTRRAAGKVVQVDRPGDVVALLQETGFSYVERVKLVNRTTGIESDYIATGIDGSFYGEVELGEGTNQLEVVAQLDDGREVSERLLIQWSPVPLERRLAKRLEQIRQENRALIEEIRERLARQMQAERVRRRGELRRREIELRAEDDRGRLVDVAR